MNKNGKVTFPASSPATTKIIGANFFGDQFSFSLFLFFFSVSPFLSLMQRTYSLLFCLSFISKVFADGIAASTTFDPAATQTLTSVETNGFNDNNINTSAPEESWLKQHNRYVFIIVLVLLVVALLIWYIVRSIRGMRKRLASENQGQMMMMQNTQGFPERVPVDNSGFHKMPDYNPAQQQQQQQSYSHRY